MQDRFRFRVWYQPSYREPIMLYDAERTYDFMRGEPENIPEDSFGDLLDDKDYIVMQCTGLKDKNGKLIYEGDIVKIHNDVTAKIIFDKGCFSFTDGVYNQACFWKKDTLEVIGNIYENKDLLNE